MLQVSLWGPGENIILTSFNKNLVSLLIRLLLDERDHLPSERTLGRVTAQLLTVTAFLNNVENPCLSTSDSAEHFAAQISYKGALICNQFAISCFHTSLPG
jgi:hypothetical protein